MKSIIIDNEPAIRNGLKKMLRRYCQNVVVIAEADSVASGVEVIKKYEPELVFLDIRLDGGTGLDMLKKLENRNFQVIFITAHNEYAVKAFRVSALDYLLKPIDPDELMHAVEKAQDTIEKENLNLRLSVFVNNMEALSQNVKKIVLRESDNVHVIKVGQIVQCKAEGSYTCFCLDNGQQILVSKNLKEYENFLQDYGFYRPHYSYLVNIQQISRLDKSRGSELIMKDGSRVPVSIRRREQLKEMLSML